MTSSSASPWKKRPGGRASNGPRLAVALAGLLLLAAPGPATDALEPGRKPADAPAAWKPWIGEYGPDDALYSVRESGGRMWISSSRGGSWEFPDAPIEKYASATSAEGVSLRAKLHRGPDQAAVLFTGDAQWPRRSYGLDSLGIARTAAVRPLEELRAEARQAVPPAESGDFRKPDLVELARLDPTIHLDIRYATSNDFLGVPVYTQARAFLERPAAEALLRVQQKLRPLGYGLVIHDGYRPWYVTKIFWEATPPEGKIFVANPAEGSRHNRGCAVDLTLYQLGTGLPVDMPGTYDEMSPRSFPAYSGGTSLERWHRDLLRRAMESERFTVYSSEWWHFDFEHWREYPILNVPFEQLTLTEAAAPND